MKYLLTLLLATIVMGNFCPDPVPYGNGYLGCAANSTCASMGPDVFCLNNQPGPLAINGVCQKPPKTCTNGAKCYKDGLRYSCKVPEGVSCTPGGSPCIGGLVCRSDGTGYKCLVNNALPNPNTCNTIVPSSCASGRTCVATSGTTGTCLVSPGGQCKASSECMSSYSCYKGQCLKDSERPLTGSATWVLQLYNNFRECLLDYTNSNNNPDYVNTCVYPVNFGRDTCCRLFALPNCINNLDGITERPGRDLKQEIFDAMRNNYFDVDIACSSLYFVSTITDMGFSNEGLWPRFEAA